MKNIMVTDVSYDESDEQESVCVFTDKMTLDQLKIKLDKNPRVKYTDIYEVDDNDLQFYVYESIWE
jgi:hypothetical protein